MRYEWRGSSILRDGAEVATGRRGRLRARAEVEIAPYRWVMSRQGWQYVAVRDGEEAPRLRAWHRSLFSLTWDVEAGDHTLEIEGAPWSRVRRVSRDGVQVATIGPAKRVGLQRPAVDVHGTMPVEEAVFLLWLGYAWQSRNGGD